MITVLDHFEIYPAVRQTLIKAIILRRTTFNIVKVSRSLRIELIQRFYTYESIDLPEYPMFERTNKSAKYIFSVNIREH